ncbi:hypothetical protein Pyn_29636 [Prunus yedoensis var. nudiflora]|uniref:Uncharacterized protein n=1 Tax=Prunus yedoensis var. nudiflora TaxID=2094558 RepID=A0A314Y6Z2_PRUYE|nr:hypothetical protein Pyn_29636 [Prunus yedoensis var. nudiflora]
MRERLGWRRQPEFKQPIFEIGRRCWLDIGREAGDGGDWVAMLGMGTEPGRRASLIWEKDRGFEENRSMGFGLGRVWMRELGVVKILGQFNLN